MAPKRVPVAAIPIVATNRTRLKGRITLPRSTWNRSATTGTTTHSTIATNKATPMAFPAKMAARGAGDTRSAKSAPSSRSRCHVRPRASTLANATASQIAPGATRVVVTEPE
jgi:hypothetical protein